MRRVFARYDALLISHPYLTKATGTGVTYVFSDLTAQAIEARREPAPLPARARAERALKFGAVGFFWIGPVLTWWFAWADRWVPGTSARPVLAKVALNQTVLGPPLLASMFCLTALTNGASAPQIGAKLDAHLWDTWRDGVCVWAPVELVQQSVVPLRYRVAVSNVVSYFWDTYLSLKMMDRPAPAPGLQRSMTQSRFRCDEPESGGGGPVR